VEDWPVKTLFDVSIILTLILCCGIVNSQLQLRHDLQWIMNLNSDLSTNDTRLKTSLILRVEK